MNIIFSFIIPVYNGEDTIIQCLNSIENQSLKNYEIIVVDNGSTDKTREIVSKFSNILYIRLEERNRSLARNKGAMASRGEYLCFIDSDVFIDSNWLLEVKNYLTKIPIDFLATSVIPACNQKINSIDLLRYHYAKWKSHNSFLSLRKRGCYFTLVNTAACAMSKESFEMTKGFNTNLTRNEDLELSVRMYLEGFILGGTTNAHATVLFSPMKNNLNRVLEYFKRSFEVYAHPVYKSKMQSTFSLSFYRYLISNKMILPLLFSILNSLASKLGLIYSKAQKRNLIKIEQLKMKRGKIGLLLTFLYKQKIYSLDTQKKIMIIDGVVYISDKSTLDNFKKVDSELNHLILNLLKGVQLKNEEMEKLLPLSLFHY